LGGGLTGHFEKLEGRKNKNVNNAEPLADVL